MASYTRFFQPSRIQWSHNLFPLFINITSQISDVRQRRVPIDVLHLQIHTRLFLRSNFASPHADAPLKHAAQLIDVFAWIFHYNFHFNMHFANPIRKSCNTWYADRTTVTKDCNKTPPLVIVVQPQQFLTSITSTTTRCDGSGKTPHLPVPPPPPLMRPMPLTALRDFPYDIASRRPIQKAPPLVPLYHPHCPPLLAHARRRPGSLASCTIQQALPSTSRRLPICLPV